MLGDKVSFLLTELKVNIGTVSEYAGISRAALSHIKGGSRKYTKKSKTIMRFVEGICNYAELEGKREKLCSIVGYDKNEPAELKNKVLEWLFSYEENNEISENPDPVLFGKKLIVLMDIAGISGSKLSRELNIDASYVSRMRSGERMPQKKDRLMKKLCNCLAGRIIERGRTRELADIIDVPENYLIDRDAEGHIFDWLCNQNYSEDVNNVKAFIKSIAALPESFPECDIPIGYDKLESMMIRSDEYSGDEGLRQSVIRFLSDVSENPGTEMLLYSDRDMDWITDDYRPIWAALMLKCVKAGVRIKIIHNIDRSASEMIKAINSWISIYLSGMVESYYCTVPNGGRFSHTFFLSPGHASIEGCSVIGMEERTEYRYITAPEKLNDRAISFSKLIENSKPLILFSNEIGTAVGNYSVYNTGNVQICISKREVIVNKLANQPMSFRITHPLLCRAFRSFAESIT